MARVPRLQPRRTDRPRPASPSRAPRPRRSGRERFTDLTRGPTRLGLCHGDLSLKNVIVDDGSVQVIDYTAGKLDLIGLSNATRADVETALELVDVAGVQNAYSILDRTHDDVIELCRDRSCRSSRSAPRSPAARRSSPRTRTSRRPRPSTTSPPPRSHWPGCSTATTACSSSRAPRRSRTSRRGGPRPRRRGSRDARARRAGRQPPGLTPGRQEPEHGATRH